jgi:hypothetical protein
VTSPSFQEGEDLGSVMVNPHVHFRHHKGAHSIALQRWFVTHMTIAYFLLLLLLFLPLCGCVTLLATVLLVGSLLWLVVFCVCSVCVLCELRVSAYVCVCV